MIERPFNSDDTAVKLADWVEIELAGGSAFTLSIDELTDSLTDAPSEISSDEEKTGEDSKSEQARQRAEEAFQEIAWRCAWLADRYPVVLEDGGEVVGWNEKAGSASLCEFLILLRARHLTNQIGDDANAPDPGLLFEEVVTAATGSYVGVAVRFGVSGGSRGDGLPLDISEALVELGRRMHEEPATGVPGGADYRADAVAWRPFGDRRPGQIVVLTQATISEGKWKDKEIAPRWRDGRLMQLVAPPLPAVAFVETMSLYPSSFWRGLTFSSLPLDRLRIASLLLDSDLDASVLERMTGWSAWAKGKLSA